MRILVNGACGHMGRAVMQLAESGYKGASLAAAVDPYGDDISIHTHLEDAAEADVIIDFSHHSATPALLDYAVAKGLPIVIATTGHSEAEKKSIHAAAALIPVFYSANMSVGVAALCSLVQQAAALFPDADIEIVEAHHNRKLDAPSGTALMLADAVRQIRPDAKVTCGRSGQAKRQPGEIGIQSIRLGNIVGIHEVLISTGTQTITLKHEAHDRKLFAEGAIDAAAYLEKKTAGLYNMQSMIGG
jgi:4-hydroxy-tetrahydrodipicolinate reductase